jgi:trk system potassium uptake protein TrkH
MITLTYSGDSSHSSEENIKKNIFKIFIYYCILSLSIFLLFNLSGVRLFNSLNLSMTLISNGGFLPIDSLGNIISSNFQKIIFITSLFLAMFNFYLVFNVSDKKIISREHKEDLYLLFLSILLVTFIYFNSNNALDLIIAIISSLSNSGLTLIKSNNLSLYFLFITIIGGSLISNTSGIKLARFYILIKITSSEIIKLISPNSVVKKTIFSSEKTITDDHIKISFLIFISFFLSLFILSSFLILDDIGFEKSFKLSILTLTNTVNSELFNMENVNFANLLTSSKISLIIFMIIAKIELLSVFLIFKKIFFKD